MAHIIPLDNGVPKADDAAFLAPTATLSGDVIMAEDSSAFYGVSVRGDTATISVGERTNLQDNVVLHADEDYPCTVGNDVTVGHSAVVHGCTIGDRTLIGMSATIMNGAEIGKDCLVAAGALVLEDTKVPDGSLVAGAPAKVRRELTQEELDFLPQSAAHYVQTARRHAKAID